MTVTVKVCGITNGRDAVAAVTAGVDALGFVFADSPRRVTAELAREIVASLPRRPRIVAVFRHPDDAWIREVVSVLAPDEVQAEPGGATPVGVPWIPVLHDGPDVEERAAELPVGRRVHLEGPGRGGRGVGVDRSRARTLAERFRLQLAGGLTPDNVGAAVREVRPAAVDVSSGVESEPGIKDADKVARFVRAARGEP